MSETEKLIQQVNTQVETIVKSTKEASDKIAALAKDAEDGKALNKEALAKAEAAAKEVEAAGKRLQDIEQKMADKVIAGKEPINTLGRMVVQTQQYKDFVAGKASKASMTIQANTITGQTGGGASSDILVEPTRLQQIIPLARRNLRVEDALPSGVITSNSLEYPREKTFTNNAAETAEAAQKPESAAEYELINSPVRTIAHFIKVTKQILQDSAVLEAFINSSLAYGVNYRVDSQLLNGTGSGQQLSGLLDDGNYVSYNPTANDTELDSINRMIYALEEGNFSANAIFLNPRDWGNIERLKGDDDHYIFANPGSTISPVLWGKPVIITNAMPFGKAHVSNVDTLAQVFTRSETVVEMFEQDADNVQKNLITVRAEARKLLAIYRPESARYGALTKPGASA